MAKPRGKPFQKGKSGNPKGRPPVILPEVTAAANETKNVVKALIMSRAQDKWAKWIDRIIEQGVGEGDAVRFKALLEMAVGKVVEEPKEFDVSEEEKEMILEWRKMQAAKLIKNESE